MSLYIQGELQYFYGYLRETSNRFFRHYVAFVRKELPGKTGRQWILFNDEKVVEGGDIEEMKQFAYVYFFRRV